jgi:hypothetical protein
MDVTTAADGTGSACCRLPRHLAIDRRTRSLKDMGEIADRVVAGVICAVTLFAWPNSGHSGRRFSLIRCANLPMGARPMPTAAFTGWILCIGVPVGAGRDPTSLVTPPNPLVWSCPAKVRLGAQFQISLPRGGQSVATAPCQRSLDGNRRVQLPYFTVGAGPGSGRTFVPTSSLSTYFRLARFSPNSSAVDGERLGRPTITPIRIVHLI